MLYDYNENHTYEIDLSILNERLDIIAQLLLMQCAIKNSQQIMDEWKKAFAYLYFAPLGKMLTHAQTINEQVFSQDIYFNGTKFYLQFNINALDEIAKDITPQNVNLNEFKNHKIDYIEYSEQELLNGRDKRSAIYIVPFYEPPSDRLVVDGNHRLGRALLSEQNKISVLQFTFEAAAESLMHRFEQAYYYLQKEILALQVHTLPIFPLNQSNVNLVYSWLE